MTANPERGGGGGGGRFRLNPWLTVCTLIALGILLWLGFWQLDRRDWKRDMVAERIAGLAAPAATVSEVPADWRSFEFRRVRVTGRYLHGKDMRLVARSHNRRVGVHIVTPLRLAEGVVVLVNRGWAPRGWKNPIRPETAPQPGPVTVEGVLRAGGRPSRWTPDNEPAGGVWYYTDASAMARAAGLSGVKPYILDATAPEGAAPNSGRAAEDFPIGGQTRADLPNNHLQYALTWFALAAALIGVYIAFHLKRR